jgi:hypothetical protein
VWLADLVGFHAPYPEVWDCVAGCARNKDCVAYDGHAAVVGREGDIQGRPGCCVCRDPYCGELVVPLDDGPAESVEPVDPKRVAGFDLEPVGRGVIER